MPKMTVSRWFKEYQPITTEQIQALTLDEVNERIKYDKHAHWELFNIFNHDPTANLPKRVDMALRNISWQELDLSQRKKQLLLEGK